MFHVLRVLVVLFFTHGAQALICGSGPGNSLYGFYALYRESTYVVLATPVVIDSTAQGERKLILKVSKSWRKEPEAPLTIVDSPDFYYLRGPTKSVLEEEQIIFLQHGDNERISWACGQNSFPVSAHTFESLGQIRNDYVDAGLLGPRPVGGIVCVKPRRRQLTKNQRSHGLSARIDKGVRIKLSDTLPSYFANVDVEESHLMSIKKNGNQVASFWFKFEPGNDQICLYESHRTWKYSSDNCGCVWDELNFSTHHRL